MRRALLAAALLAAAPAGCGEGIQGPLAVPAPPTPALAPGDLPAFFDCLRERDEVVVSAHRGRLSHTIPENALEAFRNTVESVPAFLEVDIASTNDGVLVLMHDDTVDRTTNGHGAVSEMSVEQFRALRIDNPEMIPAPAPPTLREALDWADGRTVLELDIKRGVAYEEVVREVEAAEAMERVIFITYSIDGAARLARLAPEVMIYTTISGERELDLLERRGVDLHRIVAWTGTAAPDTALREALAARGVEARFGMFGEDRDYASAAGAGQIIAVDYAAFAHRALDAADGEEGYAALRCAAAQ
jgi:glycerophosphoryl diester phosphodiesterase